MAQLLYSAKTADGKATQGFVEAGSAREGRDKLAASGLTEIVLHQEVGVPRQGALTAGLDAAVVALRRGAPGAVDLLGQATAEFLQRAAQPAVWTALAFCACDHAIALAQAGRKDEARRELAQVWPILSAHADKPLLRLLQRDGLT